MATITLKNISDALHKKLKSRALRHRRSLNSEVLATLEKVVASECIDPQTLLVSARKLRSQVKGRLTDKVIRELKTQGRP